MCFVFYLGLPGRTSLKFENHIKLVSLVSRVKCQEHICHLETRTRNKRVTTCVKRLIVGHILSIAFFLSGVFSLLLYFCSVSCLQIASTDTPQLSATSASVVACGLAARRDIP